MNGFTQHDLMVNNANGYVFNKDKGVDKKFLLTISPELDAFLRSAGDFFFLIL
jgi:hypothetical protein